MSMALFAVIATQLSQVLHGLPFWGFWQFSALAKIRAVEVFQVHLGQ
jgi:hypothetical protein